MKKRFPVLCAALRFLRQHWRLTTIGLLVSPLLAGCMATQNRWQATQMRQQVMDYYNDQIMENLIRAKQSLPFVHVDVTSLTATDAASLAGTVGAGETPSFTQTSRSSGPPPAPAMAAAALHTIVRGVTRPFSYSVTPTRNTSLQIIASPAFGEVAPISTPTPTATPVPPATGPALMLAPPPDSSLKSSKATFRWSSGSGTAYLLLVGSSKGAGDIFKSGQINALSATVNNVPIDGRTIYVTLRSNVDGSWSSKSYKYTAFSAASLQTSKITETVGQNGETETETELSAQPVPTPKPLTVYDLYEGFVNRKLPALISNGSTPPKTGYVSGTIKRWAADSKTEYYYIKNDRDSQRAYYELCKALFTKGKAQSIESKVEQISQREGSAAVERAFTR